MSLDDTTPPRFGSFNEWLRYQTRHLTTWAGEFGLRLGLHPDLITVLGLLAILISAWLAARGDFVASGIALLIATPLDVWDGAIARAMKRQNRFGALLDSTLDRYADGLMFCGLAYYYAARGQMNELLLVLVALIGAYVISYVRARAEGLGIRSIREGLFDRFMRLIILILMLLTGLIVPGLVILAVGNHLTAVQRMVIVYRATRGDETQ